AFVTLEALPLTANGKLDRRALPVPEGRPEGLAYVAPRSPTEAALAQIWGQVLRLDQVGVHDNFFELGGDSIQCIQIAARAKRVGVHVTVRQIFERQTVAELAAAAVLGVGIEAEQGLVSGEVPLTPIQHWLLDADPVTPHHFNQSFLLACREPLSGKVLAHALEGLSAHHDALRLRFERTAQGWRQWHAEPQAAEVEVIDLSGVAGPERAAAITERAGLVQASLDLGAGPVLRAALFELGPGQGQRLLLTIHHLAVDAVSWRVLLEDLPTLYGQAARGMPAQLPAKSTSFKSWAEHLAAYAGGDPALEELAYWRAAPWSKSAPLPRDLEVGANDVASAATVEMVLEAQETQALLQEVPGVYHTQINDALLTALAEAFAGWTGRRSLLVGLEGHGREELFEDVDVSRTVGWFTSLFPVLLDLEGVSDPGMALKAVKEQLRAVPRRGVGYGVLRYLGGEGTELAGLPQAEVTFNYLGQVDQAAADAALFAIAPEDAGAAIGPRMARGHLIEVTGAVVDGRLRLQWTYSRGRHTAATIEGLAAGFAASLRRIIAHCRDSDGGYTPSDFTLLDLEQAELDRIVQSAGGAGRVADIYPVSPLQQGLLFHTLYAPASTAYVTTLSWRLAGALDAQALRRAWDHLVQRHDILRTAFVGHDLASPLQVVLRQAEVPFETFDWRALAGDQQALRLAELLAAERERPFDFARPPLMRLCLIRTGEAEHRLIWTSHHVLLDGWSLPILLADVFAAYAAYAAGQEPRLGPAHPYRDHIAWLQQQDKGRGEAYWRARLAGFEAPTPLAVDRPSRGPAGAGDRHAEHRHVFKLDLKMLEGFARSQKLTLNTLALGSWALVLSRYSGQPDVVFGVTVSGRPTELADAEQRVGLFINTLPLRVASPPESTVAAWLAEIQARQNELIDHQSSALVDVQRWSELAPGAPLFHSGFVFENYPFDGLAVAEGAERAIVIDEIEAVERPHYPITLAFMIGAEGLVVRLTYDTDLFDAATIGRLAGHLERVLEQAVADPGRRLGSFDLLDTAERRQLLVEWNDTAADYPRERLIHEGFEARADEAPAATGLVTAKGVVTYGELNSRANQIAHALRASGLLSGDPVGVLLRRNEGLVVAVLAIAKAGGVFAPLDPDWPQDRLMSVIGQVGIGLLVTQLSLLRVAQDLQWLSSDLDQLVCLDLDQPHAPPEPADWLAVQELFDHLGAQGATRAERGGFVSSYTGAPFSEAEIDEYVDRIEGLLEPFLDGQANILEIGAGSGVVAARLAPRSARYVAMDPAAGMLRHAKADAEAQGISQLVCATGFAHEISASLGGPFDVVLLASVVQFFPGYGYLRQVIDEAVASLKPGGILLIADVPDLGRREDLRRSLEGFWASQPKGQRHTTSLDSIFHLAPQFFRDLDLSTPCRIEIRPRLSGFSNELGYRYDVILRSCAPAPATGARAPARKGIVSAK
ncbi:condensation domain-containing protein, partial [Phenylobacterium sp.]|uniref:condensation domain-containing protein n=1 Tax=Phenylobacterium sp. TaxID=1871053 RepID=UPI0037C86131